MAKRNLTGKMNLGWLDIPFNHGRTPGTGAPILIHVVQPGEVPPSEAFGLGQPNLVYDFETDTVYSVDMDGGSERGFLHGVAETLEQYKPGEL